MRETMPSSLPDVARFATSLEPTLDERLAAAFAERAADVLSQRVPDAGTPVTDRVYEYRRRQFAYRILTDPLAVATRVRWALATSDALLTKYVAGGAAAVTDQDLRAAAVALWDVLSEA